LMCDNATASTHIYTLSLHDALPIFRLAKANNHEFGRVAKSHHDLDIHTPGRHLRRRIDVRIAFDRESLSLIGATKDTSPGQGAEVLADPKRDFLPKVRPVRLKHREPREIRQLLAQVNHGSAGADVPHGELTVQRPAAHDA